MQQDLKVWKFISEQLHAEIPVVLLVVPESIGSSPGRRGFKMAVTADKMTGSIGGGIMEYKFVELAKEKLRLNDDGTILKKQVHDKQAKRNQSGMICSGEQTIILYNIGKSDLVEIDRLISSLQSSKIGKLSITSRSIEFSDEVPDKDYRYHFTSDEEWFYEEKTGYKNKLFIVGAGHCGLSFTRLMSSMDFYISIYDDRPQLNTFLENQFAHERIAVNDYSELAEKIPSGENHYVVIMTFGYRTDDIALRSLIKNDFKYLGVLGSKNKMMQLMDEWRRDGLSEDKLSAIYTPIGLPIRSQTPEEIAISIAAQIISVKNSI